MKYSRNRVELFCNSIIEYFIKENSGRRFTMGIYLNPGNASFRGSLRSKIYVDKSGLIAKTNDVICTEQKYVCVSEMAIIIV